MRSVIWCGLSAGLFVLTGCGPDAVRPADIHGEGIPPAFLTKARAEGAGAGHIHNEVQRAVLRALQGEKAANGAITKAALPGIVHAACRQALASLMGRTAECDQILEAFREQTIPSKLFASVPAGPLRTDPSQAFVAFLDDIATAVQAGPTAGHVTQATDAVVSSAAATLTDTLELYSISLVASVADSSAVYWEAEWDDWEAAAAYCDEEEYPEGHPNCPIPPQVPAFPRFDAWYDWICNSHCRNVISMDASAAIGAAMYNWVAGPAGAASTLALSAGGSATQAALELFAILAN